LNKLGFDKARSKNDENSDRRIDTPHNESPFPPGSEGQRFPPICILSKTSNYTINKSSEDRKILSETLRKAEAKNAGIRSEQKYVVRRRKGGKAQEKRVYSTLQFALE